MLRKVARVIIRRVVALLVYVDTGLYMRAFNWYLRWSGFQVVGTPRFISSDIFLDGGDPSLITLGDDIVISAGVRILTHDFSVTRALLAIGQPLTHELCIFRPVTVGRNSFIGMGALLMPGAEIGENAIIGAGCVVRGKCPDNSIMTGNPGQVVGDVREWAQRYVARIPQLHQDRPLPGHDDGPGEAS